MIPALEAHAQKLGRAPHLAAGDAAFYSTHNESTAHEQGVKRVCIPNRSTKSAERKGEPACRPQPAEEALVPPGPEVEDGMRGAHQCTQAAARAEPLPLQRRFRNEALGGSRRDRG